MKNPATAGRKQGSSKIASLAASDYVDSPNTRSLQSLAVRRLAVRFGMTPSTAALVVELAGIGGA